MEDYIWHIAVISQENGNLNVGITDVISRAGLE